MILELDEREITTDEFTVFFLDHIIMCEVAATLKWLEFVSRFIWDFKVNLTTSSLFKTDLNA